MSEVTLLEQTKLITDPQKIQVANVFATEYAPQKLLPFERITGYHKPFTLVDTLPTVAPRDFGVDFTSDYGKSSTYNVPWKNYGGKLEVDKSLRKGNPAGAAMQELMQIQSIAKQWATDVFQGTGGTSMTGVKTFLEQFFPGQVLDAAAGTHTNGGDLLTMADMDAALNLIDKEGSAIFCSQILVNRLTYLARTNASGQQNIFWAPDSFGEQVLTYNKIPIYTMIDQYTSKDLLSVTDADYAVSGAATCTRLYIVNFGDMGVKGFSPDEPVLNIEMANPGTHVEITRLEMNTGITVMQPRSAVEIRFIKNSVT